MKVILLQDVARIGRRHEIKEVPDGHALNFLVPRKLAEPATGEALKRRNERMAKLTESKTHAHENFEKLLEDLKDKKIVLTADANEKGHLFKGVKADDIAAAVTKEVGVLKVDAIVLKTPLKEVGDHTIELSHDGVKGSFVLTIASK